VQTKWIKGAPRKRHRRDRSFWNKETYNPVVASTIQAQRAELQDHLEPITHANGRNMGTPWALAPQSSPQADMVDGTAKTRETMRKRCMTLGLAALGCDGGEEAAAQAYGRGG
jgi:hypothetical protein